MFYQTNKSIIFSLILHGYYLDSEARGAKWVFQEGWRLRAEGWEKFQEESDGYLNQVDGNIDAETFDNKVTQDKWSAALETIPKSKEGSVK